MFLQDLPVAADHDHTRIVALTLNTLTLGEHVAPHWKLQEVMRWAPPRAGDLALDGRGAGVHKVAGTAVEAVAGGVLHQVGVSLVVDLFIRSASAFTVGVTIPDVLYADALSVAECFGGLEASEFIDRQVYHAIYAWTTRMLIYLSLCLDVGGGL